MVTFITLVYFNSIKVRLKLVKGTDIRQDRVLFQFHKGTIKTLNSKCSLGLTSISIP